MIEQLKSEGISINNSCKILSINRSNYYRNKKEKPDILNTSSRGTKENEDYLEIIKQIRTDHHFWGYRRIRAYIKYRLKANISNNRVYRIMKDNDLMVKTKKYKAKRKPETAKPKPGKPNHWWGTDMTKFYVNSVGWLYLVIVLDWYTKKVVGYKLNLRSKTEDWLDALNMAVEINCPLGAREYSLNLMSDNGSQPTSTKYEKETALLEINHITTSYSNPKGNADTERFMRTFKEETIYPNDFDSFEEAKQAVDDFIAFYNQIYPHSALGYLSPVDFENLNNLKYVA